jgi:Ca-activated chloride channel family protein
VAIVLYDAHARLILEHTPASQKKYIMQAIDRMQCGGSTNLEEGMQRAYQLAAANFAPKGENRVLLLSDGVANLGSGSAEDILKKIEAYRNQGITCSVFGFGMGSYDDTMLETLANKGDGTYSFIDSKLEAKRIFVDELSATLNTIAADVKIQVEYNPAYVARYRQLGYENRKLKKEDFRNDSVDAGEIGSGQAVTALYELELNTDQTARINDDLIATVRVRYRRIDTGKVEEIEHRVHYRDLLPSFEQTTPHFKLAAVVAEFAEILRGSPFATGSKAADAAEVLRPVALDLNLNRNVRELLQLIESAKR